MRNLLMCGHQQVFSQCKGHIQWQRAFIFSWMFDTKTSPRQFINKSRTTRTFSFTLMPIKSMRYGEFPWWLLVVLDICGKSHHRSKRPLQKHPCFVTCLSLLNFLCGISIPLFAARLVPSLQNVDVVILFHFSKGHFVHKTIDVNLTLNSRSVSNSKSSSSTIVPKSLRHMWSVGQLAHPRVDIFFILFSSLCAPEESPGPRCGWVSIDRSIDRSIVRSWFLNESESALDLSLKKAPFPSKSNGLFAACHCFFTRRNLHSTITKRTWLNTFTVLKS